MRFIRSSVAAIILCATLAAVARAQQPQAPAPTKPSLEGKVAIIDTSAFADEKAGIRRIIEAVTRVNNEFQPRSTELQQLRARYDQLVKEINATPTTTDQQAVARKADDADSLKRDIERKSEDAKTAYEKRLREALAPLQDDVFKALDAYAKENGISVIIDASQVPVLYGDRSIDITAHFIGIYNQRNPATGAAATTAGAPAGTRKP
ncbi:MAG: outer membrane protein [Acidobacteriota bacterium]|jgi:outer membrane protein|nr:outer membrane protein [Acidobacteriota bacterium]